MAEVYDPLDCTEPQPTGPMVFTYPFADVGDESHVVASQEYNVIADDYEPPTIGSTITIGAATLYCVGDSEPQKIEAGLVNFTRKWASKPATRFDYESFAATFPGLLFQRDSFTRVCTSQVQYEYFVTDPSAIPQIPQTGFRDVGYSLDASPDGFYLSSTTTPTAATYAGLVSAAAYTTVVEASSLSRYMGNIYQRVTRRVKPQ